jgi:hypothetical protein
MATFLLTAKTNIGSGKNRINKGAFIQISKNCDVEPMSFEIKEAIQNQLGIELLTTPHKGQFKVQKL